MTLLAAPEHTAHDVALVPDATRPPAPSAPPTDGAPSPVRTRPVRDDRRRAMLRVAVAAVAVAAALPFSLMSLSSDYQYGAALGELALIPLCALALALVAAYRHPWVAQLRAGRADYVAAGFALLLGVALLTWGTVAAGNHYFALRPDLLALPLVAVAAVCLLFGVRALVAFVVPVGVLVMAWPLPLRALVEPVADLVARATSTSVRAALEVLPLATVVPGPGDLRLHIAGRAGEFDVLVASACSGISGILGMLMVGLCAQYVLHGSRRARLAWIGSAVVIAWVLNLVRILALLALGRTAGEQIAMDVVHPVAGLILLNTAMAVHVLLARRFGLTFSLQRRVPSDTPLTAPAPLEDRMTRGQRGRRAVTLVGGVVVLALLGTTVPWTAAAYAGSGAAVSPFSEEPDLGVTHELVDQASKPWAEQYFGTDSSWVRYRFAPAPDAAAPTVWVDSVLTEDWAGLRAHPLLDCYAFHEFELVSVDRPVLHGDLLADQIVYRRADGATWHVLSWEWAVRTADGTMAHERVTLLASSSRTDLATTADGGATADGGLRGELARRLSRADTATDPNPALTGSLRGAAGTIIESRTSGSLSPVGGAA